jgi:hypothetical protein
VFTLLVQPFDEEAMMARRAKQMRNTEYPCLQADYLHDFRILL